MIMLKFLYDKKVRKKEGNKKIKDAYLSRSVEKATGHRQVTQA